MHSYRHKSGQAAVLSAIFFKILLGSEHGCLVFVQDSMVQYRERSFCSFTSILAEVLIGKGLLLIVQLSR